MKILLFGTGKIAEKIAPVLLKYASISILDVVGFIDNNPMKYGKDFYGYKIYHPGEIYNLNYDKIVICVEAEKEIKEQLILGYKIPANVIDDYIDLLKFIMTYKYKESEDVEIQEILKYWQDNILSIFNQYIDKKKVTYDEVIWDKNNNLPYIMFKTIENKDKKMYFPRNTRFDIFENRQVIKNLMHEQLDGSPHLYIDNKIYVNEGDVLVDAGVCEGNFALKYIDIVKNMYLIECDPNWQEPLYFTFKDYDDKVLISNKFLSNRTGIKTITLDDLVKEKIDFLKMDIEGAEIEALQGAKKTLENKAVKCSICSYHKHGDERAIKDILESYGYETWTSNGYMVFLGDEDIFYYSDFRRGIVYALKDYNE